ncbi:MAG: polyprenol monophosphomannose synthase [Elusimicrobiota bacterium]
MSLKKSKVLIIIPTYNERENIEKIVDQVLNLPPKADSPIRVAGDLNLLIIDDNSPDGTGEISEGLKAAQSVIARSPDKIGTTKQSHMTELEQSSQSQLEIIHREKKLGLGTAYIQGFKWALVRDFDFIFTMDADFSHNPECFLGFLKKLKSYDLVVGSRYVKGGCNSMPVHRKIISRLGNLYAKTVLCMPVNDCTSGFMGFRRKVLENINLDEVKSEGYGFLIEMKYRAHKLGYKIFEYPIFFADRSIGKSKISKNIIWEAIFLVWKLKFMEIQPQ